MQIDWTTFALEVLNFLVLIWILKHFFYQPVLGVLDERKARIAAEKRQAEQLRDDAAALKRQYEARLADWQREREQSRHRLEQELADLRTAAMDGLRKRLADEEAKARVRSEGLAASRETALRKEASREAYRAAAAMLKRVASPALTASIAQVFCEDLGALPAPQRDALRRAAAALGNDGAVEIAAAHRLDESSRNRVAGAIAHASDRSLRPVFTEAPELVAGLRATVGECLLTANLADELAFFRSDAGAG
jgi:F-type H+-transporting ATPase subunit b